MTFHILGGDIAYPKIHKKAGGKGTYSDPITFAGAEKSIAPGSIVYISKFKKYFIFDDECEECQEDWSSSKMYHLDLWMGPTYAVDGVVDCENQLSDDKVSTTVTLNPASTLAVNTTAFFDETRSKYNGCIEKPDTCTDAGTKCGNECKTPSAQSCSQLASLYGLAIDRFKALNCNSKYNVDCSTTVPKGKTTCMGGTCGDRR